MLSIGRLFKKNLSDQFEARLVQVQIQNSNSKLLTNMDGWSIPVASAHGEGRAVLIILVIWIL